MIDIQERPDVLPVCPHCEYALETLWFQTLRGLMGKRYVYFCPSCQKILGVTHRKGFWMG
jgi:hypothetical protein